MDPGFRRDDGRVAGARPPHHGFPVPQPVIESYDAPTVSDQGGPSMYRVLKAAALALTGMVVVGVSTLAWHGFSAPPQQHLALPPGLLDETSAAGRQRLAHATDRADYDELARDFVAQSRRGFCGVASGTIVTNAALHPATPVTQASFFTPEAAAVRSELAVTFGGMSLAEFGGLVRAHGLHVDVIHAADSNLVAFRRVADAVLSESAVYLVVNYDRKALHQVGGGHISPVAAYDRASDSFLILDVAAQKYPFTWVPAPALWQAMSGIDTGSGLTRGFALVRAAAPR